MIDYDYNRRIPKPKDKRYRHPNQKELFKQLSTKKAHWICCGL